MVTQVLEKLIDLAVEQLRQRGFMAMVLVSICVFFGYRTDSGYNYVLEENKTLKQDYRDGILKVLAYQQEGAGGRQIILKQQEEILRNQAELKNSVGQMLDMMKMQTYNKRDNTP